MLLFANLYRRWCDWRARRQAIREGSIIDIRTMLKRKGVP